jgi:hypothetical protein
MPGRPITLDRLQEWRFLQLTVVLGLWMLLSHRLADRWLVQGFMQFVLLNSMLVTLWVGEAKRWRRRILLALWGLSFAASLIVLLPIAEDYRELVLRVEVAARVPILVACAVGILTFVFRRGSITHDDIFATVAAYLLIAFAFAEIYLLLQMSAPESFRLPSPDAAGIGPGLASSLLYFSFVTIATLGYGDILPFSETARMLAAIEAVVGQFYVAVIVALLVSKFIGSPPPEA